MDKRQLHVVVHQDGIADGGLHGDVPAGALALNLHGALLRGADLGLALVPYLYVVPDLFPIHITEHTRLRRTWYAVFPTFKRTSVNPLRPTFHLDA